MRARFVAAVAATSLVTSIWAGCSGGSAAPAVAGGPPDPGDSGTAPASDGGAPLAPGVLASGQHTPAAIVADATHVYWINRGTHSRAKGTYAGAEIVKCAKSGCGNKPTVLATGAWTDVTNLAVDGANVYWGASGQIFKCAIDGCDGKPRVLWSGAARPSGIALDDASVYFDTAGSDHVTVCSIDGCDGGTALALRVAGAIGSAIAIAVDGESLFVVTTGGNMIVECTTSACSQTLHAVSVGFGVGEPEFLAPLIAVDSTNVYFASLIDPLSAMNATPGGGRTIPNAGSSATNAQSSILFAAKDATGMSGTRLLGSLSSPSAIAVDGTSLYLAQWGDVTDAGERASGAGRISRCAVKGCKGLSSVVQDYVNYPQGIAVDDAHVYWTDFGSGTDPSGSDDGRVLFRAK